MRQSSKLRKWFMMPLVVAMVVSLFVGCGSGGEKESPDSKENSSSAEKSGDKNTQKNDEAAPMLGDQPITVTMLYSDNSNYPAQSDWMILTEIKERLNVDLQLETVPESDYVARRTVTLNSGDLPDIITKTFGHDVSPYIPAELILPISDYIDQMPHFKAFIEKYDYYADLENAKEADGKYYFLPINANPQRTNSHGWMIRMDQVEAYGLKMPTTMDEIYEAAKVWKEHNPDDYPISNRFTASNILSKIAPAFDTIGGWTLGNMFLYDQAADNFFFAPATEAYKEMLLWTNKLYEEGLLDPEFTTLDSTLYEERIKNGEQFIMVDWIGNELRYNRDGPEQSGNPNYNVQPIMPPKGPRGTFSGGKINKFEQSWVISAAVAERDDFDLVLQFIDWFYSDEAAELTSFGREGVDFEILDNGRKEFMDFDLDYTAINGVPQNSLTARKDDDLFKSRKTDYVIDLFTQMDEEGVFSPKDPSITLTDLEKEEEGFYRSSLNDYVLQKTEEFIFGVESFDNWDAFVAECEAKGSGDLDVLYNTAYDRQK